MVMEVGFVQTQPTAAPLNPSGDPILHVVPLPAELNCYSSSSYSSFPSLPSSTSPCGLSLAQSKPGHIQSFSEAWNEHWLYSTVSRANQVCTRVSRLAAVDGNSGGCSTQRLFSPEQWLQLTHQLFVFKHLASGVMPPAALLLGSLSGGAGLGLSGQSSVVQGTIDLEPWRCRRTDGKKWRCTKEAMPGQKYCEKHIHRGGHRTRGKNATDSTTSLSRGPFQLISNTSLTGGSHVITEMNHTRDSSTQNPGCASVLDSWDPFQVSNPAKESGAQLSRGGLQDLAKSISGVNDVSAHKDGSISSIDAALSVAEACENGVETVPKHQNNHEFRCPTLNLAGWTFRDEAEQDLRLAKKSRISEFNEQLDDFLALGSSQSLGLNAKKEEESPRQTWFPAAWFVSSAATLGGPLAEAFQYEANDGLNVGGVGWDGVSGRECEASPTAVLQLRSACGLSSSESSSVANSPRSMMKLTWDDLID